MPTFDVTRVSAMSPSSRHPAKRISRLALAAIGQRSGSSAPGRRPDYTSSPAGRSTLTGDYGLPSERGWRMQMLPPRAAGGTPVP